MHRVSEAMHIASLVARRLVLSVASRRNRGEKSPDKTRRLHIVRPVAFNGACTMRVHKRRRVHPMHPSYGILAPRTQRVVFSLPFSLSLSLSLCLSPFLVHLAIYSRRLTAINTTHSQPLRLPRATKRLRNRAERSCASPIEMHRFHYKLLMRQICLSASRCLYRLPLSCAVIVSIADNNIWATLSQEPNGKTTVRIKEEKREIRFRSLTRLFAGERESYV